MTRTAAVVSPTPIGRRAAMRAALRSQTSRRALRFGEQGTRTAQRGQIADGSDVEQANGLRHGHGGSGTSLLLHQRLGQTGLHCLAFGQALAQVGAQAA